VSPDHRAFASSLVDEHLGPRLEAAGNPAGLREAAVDLAAAAFAGDADGLMRAQLRHLLHPSSSRLPDAYLADEAVAEDVLQRAAAGLRSALARAGTLVDARSFERAAAARLRDDPRLAVRAELARVPRPLTRPKPLRWSIEPAPWAGGRGPDDDPWPPAGVDAVAAMRCLPDGAAALARVDDGPRAGWTQIGMIERHQTPVRRYPDRPARQVLIAVGLEVTDTEPPADSLPFAWSPWQLWTLPWRRLDPTGDADTVAHQLATGTWPAVALTDGGWTDPNYERTGLGSPPYVLAPVLAVVAALELEPTRGVCGFSLSDGDGPGLVCRQWRGHLVHDGNYQPLTPAVEGADLLVRPDLFARLRDTAGDARIHTGFSVNHRTGGEAAADED